MRAIILSGMLLCGISVAAQSTDTSIHMPDSITAIAEKRMDSITRAIKTRDSIAQQQQFDRNVNNIMELQKENRSKQKKAAMVRIAIGVGFLIILIIGLMRRKKAKIT